MIGLAEKRLEEPGIGDVILPLLCLIFVLVVFFVLQLSSSRGPGGDLEASSGPAADGVVDRAIRLNVTGAGTIHLDGRRLELSSVHAALSQARFANPTFPVTVSAEPSAHFSVVLRVVDECQRSGAAEVRFALTKDSHDHETNDL